MGRLTTHVLNTADGIPAANMLVQLLRGPTRELIREIRTNADGRCDTPLLEGDAFQTGTYILAFHAADYFRAHGANLPTPPFFDIIEIAFGLSADTHHHHLPLLLSPWAYSTYRGS